MSSDLAVAPPPLAGSVAPAGTGHPDVAIARRAFRQVWVGALVCALAFGGSVASAALAYVTTFPDVASRQLLAATTSSDAGLAIMLGPIARIDTVGGYTTYKNFVFLTSIGAIWGLMAGTRLLRGEEDAGRWQLVLAGGTRPARATTATLVALGLALVIVYVGTTLCTLLAAQNPDVGFGFGEVLLYGLSLVVPPAVFMALGAFTSQLGRTRRTATTLGLVVLGLAFVLRMVADAGPSTTWLHWTTPFGWSEAINPLTDNNLLPLVPAVVAVVVLSVGAVVLSTRRDAGDGLLASRDVAAPKDFGLGSSLGLALRRDLGVLVAWAVGAAAFGLMFGLVATLTTKSIPESMGGMLDKFGVEGAFANQYFGVVFLLVAAVVALLPAGQLGAACDEETSGRLIHLLARPVTRVAWFGGRLALAAAGVVVSAALFGLFAWAGAASAGVPVDFGSIVLAGLNVIPTALLALGGGALVFSLAPRAAGVTVYVVVGWSLIADLLASLLSSLNWLGRTSVFHYMKLAPAQTVEARTVLLTLGLAAALCLVATVVFERRDIQS